MDKLKVGDRVKVNMNDRYGNPLYGTIIDPNFLGISILVKTDTSVSKQYCRTNDSEIPFLREDLRKIEDE